MFPSKSNQSNGVDSTSLSETQWFVDCLNQKDTLGPFEKSRTIGPGLAILAEVGIIGLSGTSDMRNAQ
jgi:hypothetical protein